MTFIYLFFVIHFTVMIYFTFFCVFFESKYFSMSKCLSSKASLKSSGPFIFYPVLSVHLTDRRSCNNVPILGYLSFSLSSPRRGLVGFR